MDDLITQYGDQIAQIARQLHNLLASHLPQVVETIDRENIGLGLAPGYKGLVFTITPRPKYVLLGIAGGAALSDPSGLLQGSGKVHRHVKLYEASELENPALIHVIQSAIQAAQDRLQK